MTITHMKAEVQLPKRRVY